MTPNPFHTFDAISGISIQNAIEAMSNGTDADSRSKALQSLGPKGVHRMSVHDDALNSDPATLLFVLVLDQDEDGTPRPPLDRGLARERIGRFPHGDGDPIGYLLDMTIDEEGTFHRLLRNLSMRFSGTGCNQGAAGLMLRGWLDAAEVEMLLGSIRSGDWKVSSDEPMDGGVADVCRHLSTHLKAARRRGCGILMRQHG